MPNSDIYEFAKSPLPLQFEALYLYMYSDDFIPDEETLTMLVGGIAGDIRGKC